ncbi:2-dehydropantoate 2-reductase [Actinomycetospora sp. NBRC 106375]|uniref:ketopantoate reductase family protein n=1 Tax=Actinomycetospora sp. NBRC 106375 TaxID=3032207 RepID=UPI0024A4E352|nr:2-dehydropantoate 2-reductase N-terminal domain-containing protein [Actinomycetospora sp. NBRC 106375]GLZ45334.1 2-dehydropantoate 2-reductase [Actinomycetospora sp. NBRC 106375]
MTRYVFVGAGAVGSALGGLLAGAGRDVLLVARGEHARAMTERGVTLRCPDTTVTVPVPVVTAPEQARLHVDDVLVLTTKTHQAEQAIDAWTDVPVHGDDGAVTGRAADVLPVLTALNGVASEEIALRYAERVVAVCVWFPVVMIEPGEVLVRTAPQRGVFHVGRYGVSPDPAGDATVLDALERDWTPAGLLVKRPDAVMPWKYRKLLTNLGNALQALLGDASGAADIQRAAEAEARAVLDAAGIAVTPDDEAWPGWEPDRVAIRPVPDEPPVMGGSSWQSLVRGTGTIETDFLNGEIVLIARRLGRAAPVNAGLTRLARRAAREGRAPGSADPDELRAQLVGTA